MKGTPLEEITALYRVLIVLRSIGSAMVYGNPNCDTEHHCARYCMETLFKKKKI